MLKIALHHLKFHGFHGLYKEEKFIGNEFEVNLEVYFNETVATITKLHETVNYAVLYELVKDRMGIPEPLLETIAMDIAQQVKAHFPIVCEINVSVSKINPPMLNFQGETSVSYFKQYQE